MSIRVFFILLTLIACSTDRKSLITPSVQPKEFSRGEIILATGLLTKIFDGEMGPIECVPDNDEASLLLRTIRPRMEMTEDDLEALLDQEEEVKKLIATCDQNCTCVYIDDLLREHLVNIGPGLRKILNQKKSEKEINRCMAFVQNTFCQSELYRTLNSEKADFSFEEGAL